ncbi:MAG: HepT-like ribonuclease domain-containing protein [Thermodesulfobacteriota bacterium]|nr:HepT-like ribonuclease domain-containing protein [Thermodesulfobacteriota bacterium]
MAALFRFAPSTFDSITRARRIVDFRNQLTHEYPTVDNALVWAIIEHDVPLLRKESMMLMGPTTDTDE